MAYGIKNHVKINPLSYNIMLLGESKCGKTTLVKEVCEKLVGEEGYLFLECGLERGCDAIEGAVHINCPEWNMDYDELTNSAGFQDVIDDIISNKMSEYPNLKVVIFDTYDQLITMAETEAIRLWNKYCRESGNSDKIAKTINAAWGGFSKGMDKAIEIMFNAMAELKKVGVSTFVIGHCKTKEITDAVSGQTYQSLTSDQTQKYFNALKKNLHFLGLAYIDREIIKEKTGKKNLVTKKDEIVGKVKNESRKIRFRDDSYTVDSGSRFADIVPEINLDADEFITALTNAIKAEQAKSNKSYEETKSEQDKIEEEIVKRTAKKEVENKTKKELDNIINKIIKFFSENKSNLDVIKPILAKTKELGYENPKLITNIDDAKVILAMTSK